jgi:SAM-dependent methyltransferase
MTCRFCGGVLGEAFPAVEALLGLGDSFQYGRCAGCGSLQILTIPADLGSYYDARAYYSLRSGPWPDNRGRLRAWLGNRLDRALIFDARGPAGWLARRRGNPVAARLKSYVGESPVRSWNARILDVGCGSGQLARELAVHGFARAEGIDPYMPQASVSLAGSPRLRRASLDDLSGERFDLVLLTHVLEHVRDPLGTLVMLRQVLAPEGVCRIEVPVADSEAFGVYGPRWVDLDPPRHLQIPTRPALDGLMARAGLEIYRREPAGSAFEFWGSEMYCRGLSLYDRERERYRTPDEVFTEAQLRAFEERAAAANARGESGRERVYARAAAIPITL